MSPTGEPRLTTGIEGLDEVLNGGLIPNRSYMVGGDPGTGKTILGLHFLTAGAGDSLYVNLEELSSEIEYNAATVGIDTSEVTFLDLGPGADVFVDEQDYDLFLPEEVEGSSLRSAIVDAVTAAQPERMFIDPLSELQHLAPDSYSSDSRSPRCSAFSATRVSRCFSPRRRRRSCPTTTSSI